MDERLKEIDFRIEILKDEIAALQDERQSLREDQAGVHVGDVVTATRRGQGSFDVLVDRVDTHWAKPWIQGRRRKKNGEWGSQSQHYYSDWKVKS